MRKHATEFAGVIDAQGVPPVVVVGGGEEGSSARARASSPRRC